MLVFDIDLWWWERFGIYLLTLTSLVFQGGSGEKSALSIFTLFPIACCKTLYFRQLLWNKFNQWIDILYSPGNEGESCVHCRASWWEEGPRGRWIGHGLARAGKLDGGQSCTTLGIASPWSPGERELGPPSGSNPFCFQIRVTRGELWFDDPW